jgi:hypothetical protein
MNKNIDDQKDDPQILDVCEREKDDEIDIETVAIEIINRHRKAYEKLAE